MPEQSHDFGPELRRRRLAARLSLHQLGQRVHYSKSQLSKVERGIKRPTPELARLCDTELGADGALSRLVPVRPSEPPLPAPGNDDEVWLMHLRKDGSSSFQPVTRRGLITVGAASVLSMHTDDPCSFSLEGTETFADASRMLFDKDTGSAVVWWLSRNEKEVEGAVDRIGLLAQLSAAAKNEPVAPPFEHLVSPPRTVFADGVPDCRASADRRQPYDSGDATASGNGSGEGLSVDSLLEWFGFSVADPDADLFAERLINLASVHGKTDAVDEIRRRFGHAPQEPPDDSAPSPGDEPAP
ncbi:helix-turn-helix domain-containing protein [Streptomyces sp. NPDC088350]|uniref:helix-turn-helix domain-containing protein n=1 Tax=Streptomyces sp. NPDC088350 TaxID=3365854 RepID=UPI00381A2900